MSDLRPGKLIAAFDSASVLHDAVITALKGQPFPHLGAPRWQALALRAGGHLPWPILRQIYTRIGAAEGIDPQRLGDVDMDAVAQWFADQVPDRRYPAIMIGSSNGALAHLAAALDVPWLPDTVLVPVAHADDPDRADEVLEFGARVAPALLRRNPDIALHHMHDPLQDELMSRWMSYFRVKWRALPTAYADLVRRRLRPGGQVIMVDDTSTWPVTRVAERHVFQAGGRGGSPPRDYLSRPHTPAADETAPEAEWGLDRSFAADLTRWCEAASVPLSTISYDGPQAPAAAVAETMRDWYRSRGEAADRLVVPSFILGDPWSTVNAAAVPFWTFFAVQPARAALDDYLGQRGALSRRTPVPVRARRVLPGHRHAGRLRRHHPPARCPATHRGARRSQVPARHRLAGPLRTGLPAAAAGAYAMVAAAGGRRARRPGLARPCDHAGLSRPGTRVASPHSARHDRSRRC